MQTPLRRFVLLILLSGLAAAQDAATLMTQAAGAYEAKEYEKAAGMYKSAIDAGAPGATAPYNAACCCALLGKSDEAFKYLDLAIEKGWRDVDHMQADADLESLRKDPRWQKAVDAAREQLEKFNKSIKEPALRDELLKRMREDQRIRMVRNPTQEQMHEWRKIDAENTAWLKTVVDKHGWPGKSMVGQDGALAAFLLVQHADQQPQFQERCLELLKKGGEQKEVEPQHVAYLTDRVLLAQGKKQRYGTQFHMADGELKPRPIEDEANVDARRKEVGLPPLAEYAKMMRSRTP